MNPVTVSSVDSPQMERREPRPEHELDVEAALLGPTMMTRCAWCGRYRVGGRWVEMAVLERATTHGICQACSAELRGAGLSA